VSFFVLPVLAFALARQVCVALQRADRRRLRRGVEFGIVAQQAAERPAYTAVSRQL
jgi:hypothetical protein